MGPDPKCLFPVGLPCWEYLAIVGESGCNSHKIAVETVFLPWAERIAIGYNTVRVGFLIFFFKIAAQMISLSILKAKLPICL